MNERHVQWTMTAHNIPPTIFSDSASARRHLQTLHEMFLGAASSHPVGELTTSLTRHLTVSPDPDMALTNFLRFAESTVSKTSVFNDLLEYPVTMEVLFTLFGHSQYLSDILVRDPELFRWLTATDMLSQSLTKEYVEKEVQRVNDMFTKPDRKLNGLRRLYRREILRVGARDILGIADLRTVTEELSNLADGIVEGVLAISTEKLKERYGEHPMSEFSIIGLGKLGGGELNYSSDIDVLFVYGDETLKTRKASSHEYFNKLAETVLQLLTESSSEGHLYRVDVRLRPESGAGPLARSLTSYLQYYESRGELWERQMLIKARHVAGSQKLTESFITQLRPFVYPKTFFHHPAESIVRIKARIEAAIGDAENVKLQSGGIRDIEFIVQALQLVNGGRTAGIRSANTLQALNVLRDEKLLSQSEVEVLSEAYQYLRKLEHRLQLSLNTQTHTPPKGGRALAALARRMNVDSAQSLRTLNDRHRRRVREIFNDVLGAKTDSGGEGITALVDGGISLETSQQILTDFGFQDTAQAAKNVAALSTGSSLAGEQDRDARSREALREVSSELFNQISKTVSPDMTLRNLVVLVRGVPFADQFYRQLSEEKFRNFVLAVCGTSPRFSNGLARNPLLLEELTSNPQAFKRESELKLAGMDDLINWKDQEELRAGLGNLLGFSTFEEFSVQLAHIADQVVSHKFKALSAEHALKRAPIAIFALGKYGTCELNLDSDLDLLFVGNARTAPSAARLERFAAGLVSSLSAVTALGKLYDVDARLRPEGRSAPLVPDRGGFTAYLESRASLWERQAFTRLRFVCGDRKLGMSVLEDVRRFVYDTPLPPDWVETTVSMRRKMETRSRTNDSQFFDIKLGPGGMADIEFVVQMIQMLMGGRYPELHTRPVEFVLAHEFEGILSREEANQLLETYRVYRSVEKLMRTMLQERGSLLPKGQSLDLLGRFMQHPDGQTLREEIRKMAARSRTLFLQISKRFPSQVM